MLFIDPPSPLSADPLVDFLQLDNADDVLESTLAHRAHQSAGVALHFPKWTDGRAYSQAVLLRTRLRFAGPIVATGEVLADMLPLLRRCGFSAVQMRADQKLEAAQRALGFFDGHYQTAAQPGTRPNAPVPAAAGPAP